MSKKCKYNKKIQRRIKNINQDKSAPIEFKKEFNSFKNAIKELLKEFDKKVDVRLSKIDVKFSKTFEDLKSETGSMRTEVYDTKREMQELKTKVNNMEEGISFHSDRQEQIEDLNVDKVRKVASEMHELNRKSLLLEKHCRKYNQLFMISLKLKVNVL